MKILTLCNYGQNRSKHLAKFIAEKGHIARFYGVNVGIKNELSQTNIDWADIIIPVTENIAKQLKERFDVGDKRIIELKAYDGAMSNYTEMENEMTKHFPLETEE